MRKSNPACALIVALGIVQVVGFGNALPVPTKSASTARTSDEKATVAYNEGLDSRNRALQAEKQAARTADEDAQQQLQQTARDEYERALVYFDEAASLNPDLPHAWNGIGFVRRKLGHYKESLEAYDRALALAPNFPDALEYRGETYLAMNRVEDAKQAYLAVFAIDRVQAEILLDAMTEWVARRKTDPAGVPHDTVLDLEAWIRTRARIADQTRLMGLHLEYRAW